MRTFLVRIATDLRVQRLVWMPITLSEEDGRIIGVFHKTAVLCDACSTAVNTGREGESLPAGYALCDGDEIVEVVCEDCRRRYYGELPVYDELEEGVEG